MAREHAEDAALVIIEIYNVSGTALALAQEGSNVPAGASRQNFSRSSRRNAVTPVRLKCVSLGQQLRSLMILCKVLACVLIICII